MNSQQSCPQTIDELEDLLSEPTPGAVATMAKLEGDLVLLGVGGKMGPTLARMAKRASDQAGVERRIIGVSRFSDSAARAGLESWGVETIAGDLLDENFVNSLPLANNVIYMAGFKFGASSQPWISWAMNCHLPALVCRRYRDSRIAAFSTGSVYGMVPVASGGSRETEPPEPVGEYAMAALGRERMFEYFSRTNDIPVSLLRLNYSCELRYGVLVDIALQVQSEQPIPLSMGYANVIWQADANAMTLVALEHCSSPPRFINIAGPEKLRIRKAAEGLAIRMDRQVSFAGSEEPDALLSDGNSGYELLGRPSMQLDTMLDWTAEWIGNAKPTLGKPTKFENREGKY